MKTFIIALLVIFSPLVCIAEDIRLSQKALHENILKEFNTLSVEQKAEYSKFKKKAAVALKKRKHMNCLVAVSDALSIFKKDADLYFFRGVSLASLQDVDGAIESYNNALKYSPTHPQTLLNLVEINFFALRYKETITQVERLNNLLYSRANTRMPLLDFKYLICLTKLAKNAPDEYGERLKEMQTLHGFMDDIPYFYYAKALERLDSGDKQEGLIWILKACLIFKRPQMVEVWNKALVDTGYIATHDIMFKTNTDQKKAK